MSEDEETTLVRELLGGLLGALIALGCFLPPLIHFVSGPFGPAIGGFVIGSYWRPGVRGRAVVALTQGAVLAALVFGAAAAIRASSAGGPPTWLPTGDLLAMILGGVFVWGAGLGAIGVALSVTLRKS